MKRTILAAVTLLWLRQLHYEKKLSKRQGTWEREAARSISGIFDRQVGEIEGIFKRWARSFEGALR